MKRLVIIATSVATAIALAGPAPARDDERETVAPRFAHELDNIPGKSVRVIEVNYAPGASSRPHTHAASAFVYAYVLSGEVESKVNDGKIRRYKAGESWFEEPGAVHSISRNASDQLPAKLLAVFIVDTDELKLTTPVN